MWWNETMKYSSWHWEYIEIIEHKLYLCSLKYSYYIYITCLLKSLKKS